MRALILLLVLVPPLVLGDAIYRSTDENGNPVFTNTPPSDDAKPMKLDPLTTVPPADTSTENAASDTGQAADNEPQAPPYAGVEVVYPPADQAVRHNGGLVPFRVKLAPDGRALATKDRVEIILDGKVRGSGHSLQVSVSPVNRGPHTVRARVVDSKGNTVVESAPVKFFLLRASVGN